MRLQYSRQNGQLLLTGRLLLVTVASLSSAASRLQVVSVSLHVARTRLLLVRCLGA